MNNQINAFNKLQEAFIMDVKRGHSIFEIPRTDSLTYFTKYKKKYIESLPEITRAFAHLESFSGCDINDNTSGEISCICEALERMCLVDSETLSQDIVNIKVDEYDSNLIKMILSSLNDALEDGNLLSLNEVSEQGQLLVNLLTSQKNHIPLNFMKHSLNEQINSYATSNGMACGQTLHEAQTYALLEILERHIVSEWWDGNLDASELEASSYHYLVPESFQDILSKTNMKVRVFEIKYHQNISCFVATNYSNHEYVFSLGSCAHFDKERALQKSLSELFQTAYRPKNMAELKKNSGHLKILNQSLRETISNKIDNTKKKTFTRDEKIYDQDYLKKILMICEQYKLTPLSYAFDVSSTGFFVVKCFMPEAKHFKVMNV